MCVYVGGCRGVYIHVCVYMSGRVTAKTIITIIIVYAPKKVTFRGAPFSDHCVWEPVVVAQWSEHWQLVQA